MAMTRELPFVKGHGTGNDFVILADPEGRLDLSEAQIQWLCDRHFGIGADGILRVVRTEHLPEFAEWADLAEYFMDYRNGDGSIAEMCGNGARVFARYLHASGLVTDSEVVIGTRGGLRTTILNADGSITVDMGGASSPDSMAEAVVRVGERQWEATGVVAPNPHAVLFVEDLDHAGDLLSGPPIEPASAYPDGANVEFVHVLGSRHVEMRVHERGVGETLSCGTGACAVAWAARRRMEPDAEGETTYRVDVPGGTVEVTETATGSLLMTGPAELVARGTALLPG